MLDREQRLQQGMEMSMLYAMALAPLVDTAIYGRTLAPQDMFNANSRLDSIERDGWSFKGPQSFIPAPEVAENTSVNNVPKTRVGQWMSKAEYEQFVKTGIIPRTNVVTKGMDGYMKQANKGDFYVEFDVDSSLLALKNEELGWSLIKSKNQMYIKLYQNKGLTLPDPIGINITHVYTK